MRLFIVILISIFSFSVLAQPAQRLLDTHMKLKSADIRVSTDGITATTNLELEYYNPHSIEMEGLIHFKLQPEQIVTGFQLQLNGKYRDGSIEEKWKATNAYNRVVGKRIDPALLTKDYQNNYSLRIYPIAAKSSRKVIITIQQLMLQRKDHLFYSLPFSAKDTVEYLNVSVQNLNIRSYMQFSSGFLYSKQIEILNGIPSFSGTFKSIVFNVPLQFEIKDQNNPVICTKKINSRNYFAIRYAPEVDSFYRLQPKRITVYWDVSASSSYRNVEREISFLKQYVSTNKTYLVTVITFNHQITDSFILSSASSNVWKLVDYLHNLTYDGGTRYSNLKFSSAKSDVVFLFSDGKSSWGSSGPVKAAIPTYSINSSAGVDSFFLKQVSFGSGGSFIPLNKMSIAAAIEKASVAENYLIDITSSGKSIFESTLNTKLGTPLLIYGTSKLLNDTITLVYGNSGKISSKENLVLHPWSGCESSAIDRISMLESYTLFNNQYNWNDVLDFGLQEKIVTPYTAYIVLERIEDYIQYNITPPIELEEECRNRGYVKKDTRHIRNQMHKTQDEKLMKEVIEAYNKRIKQWDKYEALLTYEQIKDPFNINIANSSSDRVQPDHALQGKSPGVQITTSSASLQEVVVVGYGISRKKDLTGSVAVVTNSNFANGNTTISQMLAGRVAGLNVIGSTGNPGNTATIQIRGASSLLSSAQPLYVINGMPVNGNIDNLINPNDIESITIFKDAGATALYGSAGSKGVILINTKKGRSYNYYQFKYRLKNQPDVDYLQEIKQTSIKEKLSKYKELKQKYSDEPGFYLDMAEHLFETGFKEEAFTVLMNAAELKQNNSDLFRTTGFILQNRKQFDLAIAVFSTLLDEAPHNLNYYRDLAWTYYQNRDYQKAVDVFYKGVTFNASPNSTLSYNSELKALLLTEMNAIIQLHKDSLDLSLVNPSLIKSMPCDLRITIEENGGRYINAWIDEPGISKATKFNNQSKHGGYFLTSNDYYYDNSIAEYQLKKAVKGTYKIWVKYYNGYSYVGNPPSVIRMVVFKNFGKPNQSIDIQTIMMDNQNGEIEIAETNW